MAQIGFPFISHIRQPIINTLERRRFTGGDNVNNNSPRVQPSTLYNQPDSVWIRLHSNAYYVEDNIDPRNSTGRRFGNRANQRPFINILTGGILDSSGNLAGGFENVYNYPRNLGTAGPIYRPMPGIESVNISSKGEFGQTIATTINWTCHSLDDLEEMIPFFLTPGITVVLEWGWGRLDTNIEALDLTKEPNKLRDELLLIYKRPAILYEKMVNSGGNYGALIGIISNFSFVPTDDGGFSCTTEITSMGELISALNLNESRNYITNNIEEENPYKLQDIREFMAKDFENKFTEDHYQKWVRSGDILSRKGWFGGISDMWVTWRFLENVIVNDNIKIYSGDNSESGYKPLKLNSEGVKISNDTYLYSSEPRVMLIAKRNIKVDSGPIRFFDVPNEPNSGELYNMYVHVDVIKDAFENSEKLDEALNKILVQINDAGVKLWKFKLQVNPLEDVFRVVDLNYSDAKDTDYGAAYNFGGFDGRGIMRSFSFTTKVTDALKTHIMFARNRDLVREKNTIHNAKADSGIDTLWGTGQYKDLVLKDLKNAGDKSDESGNTGVVSAKKQQSDEVKRRTLEELGQEIDEGKRQFSKIRQGGFFIIPDDVKELVSEIVRRKTQNNRQRHEVLLPLDMELQVDGITGILPGNIFRVGNIPSVYYDNGVFQVMSVEQSISPEDWTTTVRSIYRILNLDGELE